MKIERAVDEDNGSFWWKSGIEFSFCLRWGCFLPESLEKLSNAGKYCQESTCPDKTNDHRGAGEVQDQEDTENNAENT